MELHSFLILGFMFYMSRTSSQLVMRTVKQEAYLHLEGIFVDNPKYLNMLMMNGGLSNFVYWAVCIWSFFTIEYGYVIVPIFAFLAMPYFAVHIFQMLPRMLFSYLSLIAYLYFIFILGAKFG